MEKLDDLYYEMGLHYFFFHISSRYVDDEIPGFPIVTGHSVDVKIDGGVRICNEIVLN